MTSELSQTHPLNFFAGLGGSTKSAGASPCENLARAHKTYLDVSHLILILAPIVLDVLEPRALENPLK